LRVRLGVTQVDLAKALRIGQPSLSHIESRGDVEAKTLLAYVEALGGKLAIDAVFARLGHVPLLRSDALPAKIEELAQQPLLPGLGDAPTTARDVVLSIKPKYVSQILAGTKTVEMRRRFTPEPGVWALIYSTTPDRALAGVAMIEDVQKLALSTLWRKHREAAGITKRDFDDYFSGVGSGYAISLASPRAFSNPVPLDELRSRFGFEPPQSYQYASPKLSLLIDDWRPQATH
jgi:predicted transcriptional regulator